MVFTIVIPYLRVLFFAHEVGHAIQDKERYSMLVFRSKLVPVVNFTSRLSSILVFSGFIFDLFNFITIEQYF